MKVKRAHRSSKFLIQAYGYSDALIEVMKRFAIPFKDGDEAELYVAVEDIVTNCLGAWHAPERRRIMEWIEQGDTEESFPEAKSCQTCARADSEANYANCRHCIHNVHLYDLWLSDEDAKRGTIVRTPAGRTVAKGILEKNKEQQHRQYILRRLKGRRVRPSERERIASESAKAIEEFRQRHLLHKDSPSQ